jgi:hypothetical protein
LNASTLAGTTFNTSIDTLSPSENTRPGTRFGSSVGLTGVGYGMANAGRVDRMLIRDATSIGTTWPGRYSLRIENM